LYSTKALGKEEVLQAKAATRRRSFAPKSTRKNYNPASHLSFEMGKRVTAPNDRKSNKEVGLSIKTEES